MNVFDENNLLIKKKHSHKNKPITMLIIATILLITGITSVSYAFYNYTRSGLANNTLRAGKISFSFDENENISLTNAFPVSGVKAIKLSKETATNTFTITGNTSVGNSITYAVWAIPGDTSSQVVLGNDYANYTSKFKDSEIFAHIEKTNGLLDFTASTDETNGTSINELLTTYTGLPVPTNGRLLGYGTIPGTGSDVTGTFTVKTWIDESVVGICNSGCTYTSGEYSHKYYTMKISVTATDGELIMSTKFNASEYIISRLGNDGLVAVNTEGNLDDGTGTIREYRYSGGTPNNYIYFNGEIWRIIGVFDGNVKIIKDKYLNNTPTSYTDNNSHTYYNFSFFDVISFNVDFGTIWTDDGNNWTTAGLMYYLNEKTNINSYYYNLNSSYKSLIDSSVTYYLGNVDAYTNVTPSDVYNQERNIESTNLWEGNQGTWSGSSTLAGIGLLYPSDFGYAAETSTWTVERSGLHGTSASNNWLFKSDGVMGGFWTISPYNREDCVLAIYTSFEDAATYHTTKVVYPVLYLKPTTIIDLQYGDGSNSSPYLIDLNVPVYRVNFNANGGTGTMSTQLIQQGVGGVLRENTYTRNGYAFAGWNTKANGSGTSYSDEASFTAAGNITLYAQWANFYTVSYNANGGTGTMLSQTFVSGVAQKLNFNEFRKDNYAFNGWNTQPNGSGTSYSNSGSCTVTNNTTLYAQWRLLEQVCPGPDCVYAYPTDEWYSIWSDYYEPTRLYEGDYVFDYSELIYPETDEPLYTFIGMILEDDIDDEDAKVIERAFVCGLSPQYDGEIVPYYTEEELLESGEYKEGGNFELVPFCIESSPDGSKLEDNIAVLSNVFNGSCYFDNHEYENFGDFYYDCYSGTSGAGIENGNNRVGFERYYNDGGFYGGAECDAFDDGPFGCYYW